MTRYLYQPTDQFAQKLDKIKKQDPPAYKRIQDVIGRLLENPQDADGKMHGLYRDRLKKYVGKGDYRIIYYWCELCRKAAKWLPDICEQCEKNKDHAVIFIDLYHKREAKKYDRKT